METFPDQRQGDLSTTADRHADAQDGARGDAGDAPPEEQAPLGPDEHVLAAALQLAEDGEPGPAGARLQELLHQITTTFPDGRPTGPGLAADALTLLSGLRRVEALVQHLSHDAAYAYGAADPDATYTALGRAWGITRQTARAKWPGAILPRPQQSRTATLRGGTASIDHDPLTDTWTWTATGGDGTAGRGEDPQSDPDEARLDAMMFLREHSGVRPAPAQN